MRHAFYSKRRDVTLNGVETPKWVFREKRFQKYQIYWELKLLLFNSRSLVFRQRRKDARPVPVCADLPAGLRYRLPLLAIGSRPDFSKG